MWGIVGLGKNIANLKNGQQVAVILMLPVSNARRVKAGVPIAVKNFSHWRASGWRF